MYDPQINGKHHTFGVSGLLYRRNLLLYDRETESLWSQLLGRAVAGPLVGARLKLLRATQTTWKKWKEEHPDTLALSFDTGYRRNYARDPYRRMPLDRRPALVVLAGEAAKIYPFFQLEGAGPTLSDRVAGKKLTIQFDEEEDTARLRDAPAGVRSFVAFFPDARAFYPDAPVFGDE